MPTLSQIPQNNFNFQQYNSDFSDITNSYKNYINRIIENDKQNKTVFEQIQTGLETVQAGNGSEGDKQIYMDMMKDYGQRIHNLSSQSNGINGYAGLTKQIDSLKHDVMTDSRLQALQQSALHRDKLIKENLGEESTYEVTNGNGDKVRVKKNDGWDEKLIEIGVQDAINKSGVKIDETTGKAYFRGQNFVLPKYVDKEKLWKDFISTTGMTMNTKPIQSLKNQYVTLVGVPGQVEQVTEIEHSADVEGLNKAFAIYLQNNDEYKRYKAKELELQHLDTSTGKTDFNYYKQINKVQEDVELQYSNFKDFENMINSSSLDELNNFKKDHNIQTSSVTTKAMFDDVKRDTYNKLSKYYTLREQQYRIDRDIPSNIMLNEEQSRELGEQIAYEEAMSKDLTAIQNMNQSLYGSKYTTYEQKLFDLDEINRKRKKDKDDELKNKTIIDNDAVLPLDMIDTYTKTNKELQLDTDKIEFQLRKTLALGDNQNIDDYFKGVGKNILKTNYKGARDLYNNLIQTRAKTVDNEDNIKEIQNYIKSIPKPELEKVLAGTGISTNDIDDVLTMTRDQYAEAYLNATKRTLNAYTPDAQTISPLKKEDFIDARDNVLKNIVHKLKGSTFENFKSTGSMSISITNKEEDEIFKSRLAQGLAGTKAWTIVGGDFGDGTTEITPESKEFQNYLSKIGKQSKDKVFDISDVQYTHIISTNGEPMVKVTLGQGTNDRRTFLMKPKDDIYWYKEFGIRNLANDLKDGSKNMSISEYDTKYITAQSMLASTILFKNQIEDNKGNKGTEDTNLDQLESKVNTLQGGKSINIISQEGVGFTIYKDHAGKLFLLQNGKEGIYKDLNSGKVMKLGDMTSAKDFANFKSMWTKISETNSIFGNNNIGTEFNSLNKSFFNK